MNANDDIGKLGRSIRHSADESGLPFFSLNCWSHIFVSRWPKNKDCRPNGFILIA
jgi:hypothetical protein